MDLVEAQQSAREALARMKELERKNESKMEIFRLDKHTVISGTPERIKEIKSYYKIK